MYETSITYQPARVGVCTLFWIRYVFPGSIAALASITILFVPLKLLVPRYISLYIVLGTSNLTAFKTYYLHDAYYENDKINKFKEFYKTIPRNTMFFAEMSYGTSIYLTGFKSNDEYGQFTVYGYFHRPGDGISYNGVPHYLFDGIWSDNGGNVSASDYPGHIISPTGNPGYITPAR